MGKSPFDPIPTRRTLLSRLKKWDDQESWQEFFEIYWRFIYHVAIRSGLTEIEAQEVVQDTVLAVSRQMLKFKYDPQAGSFQSWLRNQVRWQIAQQLRRRELDLARNYHPIQRGTRTGTVEKIPDESADPDHVWAEEWEQSVTEAALAGVKRRVNPRHYQIFDFHVLKQMPLRQVAAALDVNRAQVYLAKSRVGRVLKEELKLARQRMQSPPQKERDAAKK